MALSGNRDRAARVEPDMTTPAFRWPLVASVLVVFGIGAASCTDAPSAESRSVPTGALSLAAFSSCDDALHGLRQAAEANVGAYGFTGTQTGVARSSAGGVAPAIPAPQAAARAGDSGAFAREDGSTPAYSGTNDHEVGVDEPDLVKTDGRRIVTVSGGVLRVVDVATAKVTGELNLADQSGGFAPANLLLDGDHALVLADGGYAVPQTFRAPSGGAMQGSGAVPPTPGDSSGPVGPRLLLVDLSNTPTVIGSYAIDGALVDARQVDSTVHVVIRSAPRIAFPSEYRPNSDGAALVATNRAVIARADLGDWLPRIEVTDHGVTHAASVPCTSVRRPVSFSGGNLLTVLTFDLSANSLGSGQPVSVAADGDTVYATPQSLYIASDQRWRYPMAMDGGVAEPAPGGPIGVAPAPAEPGSGAVPAKPGSGEVAPAEPVPTVSAQPIRPKKPTEQTTVYRFDTSHPGAPTFVGAGEVPGYLVNQYAMSEWDNTLRLATTTGTSWSIADGRPAGVQTSQSAVYVLSTSGPEMRTIGRIGGLGVQERIYSVRFIGPVGYVVTFRQTDPLYTIDLSDPEHPHLRGSLELTGYSAYLHPLSNTELLGVGRQADAEGHVGGLQVSLFDVSNLESPSRVATFALPNGQSAAEFDPHAFLYWPSDGLVVVPLQMYNRSGAPSGVLVLRASGSSLAEVGFLSQPSNGGVGFDMGTPISRALVIGNTLWTVSDGGLMANSLTDLTRVAWLPFH